MLRCKNQVSNFKLKVLILFAISFLDLDIHAQDLHFSQYYRTPIFLNPANTGAMEEDIRIMAIGRNQWSTVPVAYNSVGASADIAFPMKLLRDKFAAGIQIMADRAGDSRFTTVQATGSGAYHLVTSGVNFMILSIGANANFYNRSYNPNLLTYDNQFNGDYFDPNIPINEQFDRINLSFFDFGLGLNYQQVFNEENIISIGSSMQHILSKEQNFLKQSTNTLLQPRFNLYLNGEYRLANRLSLIPLMFYQNQDKKQELVLGLGVGWNMQKIGSMEREKVKLGASYRINDAFIFWGQYDFKRSSFQLSFDLNNSPLRIASNSYGGLELSYGYLLRTRKERERMYDFCPYIWF